MNRKSLESHKARRACVNYQRGNTKVQRAIASIIMKLPDSTKDVLKIFENSKGYKRGLEEKSNIFFDIYMYKLDKNGEENRIKVVANKNQGIQNLRIDPQGENKENYYYLAEKISNESIVDQIKYAITLLETGKLDSQSLLKKIELIDPNDFDPSEWLPKEVIEETGFDQKIYEKILLEEGEEEAVNYGKGLRGAEKPKDNIAK
ncbi:MAG: hypothetical protein PHR61_04300 [Candidatus Absconditabacteria bacterium]|nr:hypothetical protein [Candidatus Absconditabacteria bacterium]